MVYSPSVESRKPDMIATLAGTDELSEAAVRGDRAAWDELIRIYDPIVRRRLSSSFSLAVVDDIVNKTWGRLYEKSLDGKLTELRLPGLAIREAYFRGMDERRALRVLTEVEPEDYAAATDGADSALEQAARHGWLREQVLRLPARMREIVELTYWEGMPARDVAQRLDIQVQTVREALSAAYARLRAAGSSR